MLTLFFIICLSPEFLPVLGPLTRWCASTLGAALLCSSRAGSDLGLVSRWVEGFANWFPLPSYFSKHKQPFSLYILFILVLGSGSIFYEFLHRRNLTQAGINPLALSHASYKASALPSSHHSWIFNTLEWNIIPKLPIQWKWKCYKSVRNQSNLENSPVLT